MNSWFKIRTLVVMVLVGTTMSQVTAAFDTAVYQAQIKTLFAQNNTSEEIFTEVNKAVISGLDEICGASPELKELGKKINDQDALTALWDIIQDDVCSLMRVTYIAYYNHCVNCKECCSQEQFFYAKPVEKNSFSAVVHLVLLSLDNMLTITLPGRVPSAFDEHDMNTFLIEIMQEVLLDIAVEKGMLVQRDNTNQFYTTMKGVLQGLFPWHKPLEGK